MVTPLSGINDSIGLVRSTGGVQPVIVRNTNTNSVDVAIVKIASSFISLSTDPAFH